MQASPEKHHAMMPTKMICISFAAVIVTGALLLTLPICSRAGTFTNPLDALFTATSATCVTGLIVYDTYTHWSVFGQCIILLLIQIGGLGLLTFTTFFNLAIGKKLGLRGTHLANEAVNSVDFSDATKLLKMVMSVAFITEIAGALLLMPVFIPKYGRHGVFMSFFLSISAYCNAGFDILGIEGEYISLCNYNATPYVLIVIGALIVFGGLGFLVWNDLLHYRKNRKLMLHTKIVLLVTAILILIGTFIFLGCEWSNKATIGGLPVSQRLGAAFFQSITCRTAGFNSVSIENLHGITKIGAIVLMFIGAAPGSTGGGIKVTTMAVLAMTVISVIRGRSDTVVLRRRVDKNVVYKALAIFMISGAVVLISTSIIYFTNSEILDVDGVDSLFEAVSAFATVGLSAGVTGVANVPSKIALILTMFIGRVGPVSLALSLAMRGQPNKNEIIPEGKILVG